MSGSRRSQLFPEPSQHLYMFTLRFISSGPTVNVTRSEVAHETWSKSTGICVYVVEVCRR